MLLIFVSLLEGINGFTAPGRTCQNEFVSCLLQPERRFTSTSSLFLNFGFFSGKSEVDKSSTISPSGGDDPAGGGMVSGMMDSMEGFKKSQRVGKLTNALAQDLSSTSVEGSSPDGKVKVVLDCQQRPLRVDIDDNYFQMADRADISNAVLQAMLSAYSKSIEKMDDKMKNFYNDLGLKS